MTRMSRKFHLAALAMLFSVGMTGWQTAGAAGTTAAEASAAGRYKQERAACMNGSSNQDQATCLREAGAALAESRKGQADGSAADYERNASVRCERLPDADRQDCQARMKGAGSSSGSVLGGGIYRELVTREAGAPVVVVPAKP